MKGFDLIAIGGGSGLDVASAAANRGMDVAVVAKSPLGGTCLNRGCIPSNMLIHHADLAEAIADPERFGIHAEVERVDLPAMTSEVNVEIGEDAQSIEQGLSGSVHHTLYQTAGESVGERTLRVDDERITAEKVVVAGGDRRTGTWRGGWP